jgi:hypothetical protein
MPNISWQTPSNSWQSRLRAADKTDATNKNFNAFIHATATGNSKSEKINVITKEPDSIMLVVKQKKIKFIHSCKKFGGTCTNPTTTVIGLIRQGARAFPIVIDLDKAVTSQEVTVPSHARIWACKDATKLKDLDNNATTPPMTMGTKPRSQRGATVEDTATATAMAMATSMATAPSAGTATAA